MEELDIRWEHLTAVLENFAAYFQNKLQQNMLKNGSNASGNLVNSFKTEVKVGEASYEVGIWLADYWYYVNNGRGPTKSGGNGTLRKKIEEWIKVKRIVPHVGVIKTGKQAGKHSPRFCAERRGEADRERRRHLLRFHQRNRLSGR